MTDPYLEASHGKAWVHSYRQTGSTIVSSFVVEAAWAHPLWSSYSLSVLHLRDVPGVPPAIIRLPGATHEVNLFALNPEVPIRADERLPLLHPPNYTGQMVCVDDEEAAHRLELAAQAIVEGKLNPDTDAFMQWVGWFGDSNVRKPQAP